MVEAFEIQRPDSGARRVLHFNKPLEGEAADKIYDSLASFITSDVWATAEPWTNCRAEISVTTPKYRPTIVGFPQYETYFRLKKENGRIVGEQQLPHGSQAARTVTALSDADVQKFQRGVESIVALPRDWTEIDIAVRAKRIVG